MSHASKAVVFDLDGTLVDSLPDIIASFIHGFSRVGLPAPSEGEVHALIGQPLQDMYARFVPAHQVDALCVAYREHYAVHCTRSTRPFPGVLGVLEGLRERGYKLAVATTKRTDMARHVVAALGLTGHLDHVQGTDGFPHKPAPDVILRALGALGAEGLWMVGDTTHDMHAGRAAGLRTYGVTWGTHDAATLQAAGPDAVQPDLSGLLAHLPPLRA
ncbi:HAD-IA family hydrolase [Myxococcaceae bacterium GXIMD 01537]